MPQPEQDEMLDTICACVSDLINTLKPEYAQAIQRVDLDGLKPGDFAEEEKITANSARVRLFRAREALKRRVIQSCGTCAEHGCVECGCKRRTGEGACPPTG
jgi:DNA-directed RNA polymerase specialized sigma24 family protein